MPHFQGWVSLPYKQRTEESGIILPFESGAFIRGSQATEFLPSIHSLQRFGNDAPVIVRRNGKRYLQSVGLYENMITRSEELNDGAWTKTASSVASNTATAPDGSAQADVVTLNNDVAARVSHEIATAYEDDTPHDLSFFYRRNGGSDVAFRAEIVRQDGSVARDTFTAMARWQRGHISADILSGATDLEVAFLQLATPAMSRVIEIWGCQLTGRNYTDACGLVPYARRSLTETGGHLRDELLWLPVEIPNVSIAAPGQLFRGAFQVSYIPMFSSQQIIDSNTSKYVLGIEVDLGGDNPRTCGLRINGTGATCLAQWMADDGTVAAQREITFAAGDEMTFTLDAAAGTLEVEGAATGDGVATAAAPWVITPSTVYLGTAYAAGTSAGGYVSEPRAA